MRTFVTTVGLLTISNVFMTFAWYGHLRELSARLWIFAALVSWGVALFEYLFQVPANRIGYTILGVGQLKMLQEIATLSVFVPLCDLLHEGAHQTGLSVGRIVQTRCHLLGIPQQVVRRVSC